MREETEELNRQIIRVSRYDFFVESETNHGTFYRVRYSHDKGRLYCSCMDSITRAHECKHCIAVKTLLVKIKQGQNAQHTTS